MVDLDSKTLFNSAAAVTAAIAAFYFIFTVELDYSPVSKVVLVAAFLAAILLITQRTSDYQLLVLGYGVIVVSVLGLFFEVASTFEVGDELTVVGLLIVSSLLFGLRARVPEDGKFLDERRAAAVFGAVGVLAVVVLVVDVTTGGLAYELQANATVEYSEPPGDEMIIGGMEVTNPTPFPERVETPAYAVCAAGNWSEYAPPSEPGEPEREVHLHINVDDGYNEHVFGYGSETYPVRLHMDGRNLTGETFPIETTSDCPDDPNSDPYVALFEAPDDERPYRYAL